MSSNWPLKLPNLLLKKIRGSKEPSSLSTSAHNSISCSFGSLLSGRTVPPPTLPPSEEDQLTRDCKEFYERRVQLASSKSEEAYGGPPSLCSSGYYSLPQYEDGSQHRHQEQNEEEEDPIQSKILHLRKEFLSLIEVDNQLFKQLLNLNDAIMDFKELQAAERSEHFLPGLQEEEEEGLGGRSSSSNSKIPRSKSFLEDTKTFQRQRISFPATRRNRRGTPEEVEEDPSRIFYTLPSSKAAAKKKEALEWRGSSSRSSASSSSGSSYERRSWKRYSETNNSLDSGIHADSSEEASDAAYSP